MLNKANKMNRRSMGLIRIAAILLGFACILHFAHREGARNAAPPESGRTIPVGSVPAPVRTAPGARGGTEVFQATAYCVTGLTKTGVPAAPGHVAADPKVIPLGSVIHVETPFMSGVYQVMDTGELIKGKIIDIFIPSYEDCVEFGRRVVKVKVLRYGFKGNPPEKKPAK